MQNILCVEAKSVGVVVTSVKTAKHQGLDHGVSIQHEINEPLINTDAKKHLVAALNNSENSNVVNKLGALGVPETSSAPMAASLHILLGRN